MSTPAFRRGNHSAWITLMRLAQFDLAFEADDGGDEGRRWRARDFKLKPKFAQYGPHAFSVWVLCAQALQRRAFGGAACRVGACTPINEKWHDAVGDHGLRVGETPAQLLAIVGLASPVHDCAE